MEITKFKRLKQAGRDTTEVGVSSALFSDEGMHFEDDIGDEEENMSGSGDEEDEMADFIEDDEITVYENTTPIRERKPKEKKKKKKRQALGVRVTSSVLEGGHYLFGDVDELLQQRKQGQATSHKADDMDGFDPFIQTERYMGEKDGRVHEIDIPERMQIYEGITGHDSVEELSLEEESSWILNRLATHMFPLFREKRIAEGIDEAPDLVKEINKEDIVRFLNLHHVEKYDIPFIAMYRKEQCRSLLKDLEQEEAENEDKDVSEGIHRLKWHKVLWAIKELHRKWMLLQKRKSALLQYYYKHYEEEFRNNPDKTMSTSSNQLFESVITSLRNAESERDIDDVDMKFSLHFPPVEAGVDEGLFRRPKRRSQYYDCIKAGLWKVARKFGCDSEQFGLQVTLKKVRMDMLEEPKVSPKEVALNFTCAEFETPEAVLKGARHMAALEISCEPCFRRHLRSIFLDKALVSTSPTPEGNEAIDSFHQFSKVKWLHEKPLVQFLDAQWLLIQKAEEEKLLQVSIKLPASTLNELKTHSHDCYLRDGLIESGRLWNEQCRFILEDAFSNYLLPSMEKEARNLLTARAKNWLLMEYGKQLWTRVSVAPYKCKENVAAIDVEAAPRVMACCWGPGKPPTTFVMLDSMGEVLDVLHAGYLSSRSQNVNDQQRKKNDQHHLLKFLKNHQPHVVVLGAANSLATRLKDDISEIICQMEENPRDVEQASDGIAIVYGDVLLPHLYEHSQISSEQLPGKPGIVKQAVALGRYLQNPLAMIATLCDAGREILNWKLSSLDHFLPSDEKYEMIEQVMVDVTNQVGLDINLALNHEWLYAPLQFISGLGSQKAASIKKAFVGAREVRNRMELTGCGLRTKNIFHNAVGFLRVHYSNLLAIGTDTNILDDTRIHPESYCLAEELAKAVHKCYAQDDTDNDVFQELAIENLRANPNLLKGFDVIEYTDDYEKEKGENRIETFYDIKAELRHGFQDPRKAYKEPTQDEEFHMISGGFRDMLAEGRIVQATVRRVLPQRAICVLEVGLTGILSKEDFSDKGDDFDLKDKLHEGASLACKIKQIEKSKYLVFLSCKESELKSNQNQDFHDADPYYREGWSSSLSLQDKPRKEKELTEKYFTPRTIFHPRFQNMTMNEAVEFLSDKDAGECIFRPSLRGAYYLTLTLKVYDGVYAHKDIFEDGKDQTDLTSLLRLGRSLKIGDDKFRDLDEVMEQYVDPLVAHLKAMLGYRKFKRGAKAEVDDILRAEKTDYPMRITYCFCISHEHPGTFILSYIRSTNPQHNYVGLHPKGFKFQKHTFKNIDQLVAYFQKNIDCLQKTPMAPMTGKNDNKDDFKGDQQSSGLPRPYGGGGRGSYSNKGDTGGKDKKDFGYGIKNWESNSKDGFEGDDGLSAGDFSVGMGSGGTGGSDTRNWGGGGSTERWGGSATAGQAGGCASGDNQGGRGGRGRGRGRERGRGHGSCGDRGDNNGSDFKSEGGGIKGWSSFTGTEIQNGTSGKWDSNGNGNAGNNNLGGGGNSAGGWCSNTEGKDAGGGFWDGSRGRGTDSGGRSEHGHGRGNDFGRGNGRGRGRGRGYFGDDNGNDMKDSNYSTSGKWDSNGSGNAANDSGGRSERGRGRGNDFGRGNGRGRGRGRGYFGDGNGNEMKDSNYSTSGKWDSNGSGNAANGNWGGSGSNAGGWGSSGGGNNAGGGIWDGSRGRGTASGGRGERGRGRGRGRDLGRGNGRGRGRGYGGDRVDNNGNGRKEFNYSTSNCGSDLNDKGGGIKGWSSFDGTEVQNGPSGKWKSNGSGNAGNGNWGGGGSSAGGWHSSSEGKDAGGGIWDGGHGRGTASGGRSERGRGRGFGRNTGSWGNDRGADHASGGNWVGGGSGNASGSGWDSGGGRSGW